MDFLIASFGTSGDVFPCIRLGAALRGRNHRVTLLAAPVFRERAELAGLEFIATTDDAGYRAQLRDMPMLPSRYRSLFILRHAVAWNERLLVAIRAGRPGQTVVLGVERPYLWADIQAQVQWGNPCLRLVMDAPLPRHGDFGTQLPGGPVQARLTVRVHQAWNERLRLLGWRSGTNQIARLQTQGRSRLPRLGLWPAWLASRNSRPTVARSFGFLMEPTKAPRTRPPGERPLLLFVTGTTGTIGQWEAGYLRTSIGICAETGSEGILLGATEAALRAPVPTWFRCERFAPLERLLPQAAAIIHHGGIGTCALALYHAVPQLIVPRVSGQPINADLMRRLGVARVLSANRFSVPAATAEIRELLSRPDHRQRAGLIAARMQPARDLTELTTFIVEYGQRHLPAPRHHAAAAVLS